MMNSSEQPVKYFSSAVFTISASQPDELGIEETLPFIAFTGRSNSGKSTLISALCNQNNLARSSRTAGRTRLLNFFRVNDSGCGPFFLVDMPGYGFVKSGKNEKMALRKLVDQFLLNEKRIALMVIVLDARRKIGEEEENIIKFARAAGIAVIMARTKWDKLNSGEKREARQLWKKEGIGAICRPLSGTKKKGLRELLEFIRDQVKQAGD